MARSRYDRLDIINDNQLETPVLEQTNRFKEPDTFQGIKTFEYLVRRGDRLDHLAARFLTDDKYWWVIAMINNMVAPWPAPGDRIKIPRNVDDVLDRI